MIRASGRGPGGKPVITLGLSKENIERLQKNQPIFFDATELGFKGHILIVAGENEATIMRDLRDSGMNLPEEAILETESQVKKATLQRETIPPADDDSDIPEIRAFADPKAIPGHVKVVGEKGVPDELLFYIRGQVSKFKGQKLTPGLISYINGDINSILHWLANIGCLWRAPLSQEIWCFQHPKEDPPAH